MIKRKNVILSIIIIMVGISAFLFLLSNTSVPVYTVKELMDHSHSDSLINSNIQVIGIVQEVSSSGFFITDPDDVNNVTLIVYINATNVEKPAGFEAGKNVLVEGKLLSTTITWELKATMISTKCPSKYQG